MGIRVAVRSYGVQQNSAKGIRWKNTLRNDVEKAVYSEIFQAFWLRKLFAESERENEIW